QRFQSFHHPGIVSSEHKQVICMESGSFFQRLKRGLTKNRESWVQKLGTIFQTRQWAEESLEAMEEGLIAADIGVTASQKLMEILRRESPSGTGDLAAEMSSRMQRAMVEILAPSGKAGPAPLSARPWVILFLGVNGVGKTTTIGKIAAQFRDDGKKVLLVAGGTLLCAAVRKTVGGWGRDQ